MTDAPDAADPKAPPADRHPATRVTRLPYLLVVIVALAVVAIWGALTMRERSTAQRELIGLGYGDDASRVEQAVTTPPSR